MSIKKPVSVYGDGLFNAHLVPDAQVFGKVILIPEYLF